MTLDKYLSRQKTDRELIVELYIDGVSVDDIAEKFDFTRQWVLAILRLYMPTKEESEIFKRKIVKRNFNKLNRWFMSTETIIDVGIWDGKVKGMINSELTGP